MAAGYLRKCANKKRNPNKEAAEAQRSAMIRAGRGTKNGTNTYACNQCGCWHVGSVGVGRRGVSRGRRAAR